jgi:hypothetical protein
MMTPALQALAQAARPISEEDYASDRHIGAENDFFEACRKLDPVAFDEDGDFAVFCLKATPDEAIGEAIRLLTLTH